MLIEKDYSEKFDICSKTHYIGAELSFVHLSLIPHGQMLKVWKSLAARAHFVAIGVALDEKLLSYVALQNVRKIRLKVYQGQNPESFDSVK